MAEIADEMPLGSFWFQHMEAARCRFLAGAAYGKFHYHDRHAQNKQEQSNKLIQMLRRHIGL